jgi:hypothetical protein
MVLKGAAHLTNDARRWAKNGLESRRSTSMTPPIARCVMIELDPMAVAMSRIESDPEMTGGTQPHTANRPSKAGRAG